MDGRKRILSMVTLGTITVLVTGLVASASTGLPPATETDRGHEQEGKHGHLNNHCEEDDPDCRGHGPGDGHGKPEDPGKPQDDCDTDRDPSPANDHLCDEPPLTTDAEVGFGTRKITPVGDPPEEWADFFTPHPTTGVWGEAYVDLDEDDCYDPGITVDAPPELEGPREPHRDDPWNSAGDGFETGAFEVDGVTIYGDPNSNGKWDGVWANAGFGSRCTLGAHDDTWARAMVIELGQKTVAMVSLDVVGFFNLEIRRARRELAARYPNMKIDELVVSSTHTHEGVDTMGFWGENLGIDGKYPAYQAFIRSQIIDAVHEAYETREEAFARFAKTTHTFGIRDSRPPQVIDPHLLAAQFVRADGSTIGTVVNWSNHPEAQGSGNPYVSSDFVHGTRVVLEEDLGGTAMYFSGSVGGLMTPLRVDIPGFGTEVSWERTFEIGRQVALAAEDALSAAPLEGLHEMDVRRRAFYMESDNTALRGLNSAGVFDVPTYVGGDSWGSDDHTDGRYAQSAGDQFRTEMIKVELGPAVFLTVPGELFPELELGGFGRDDCPEADTGRPFEPVISDQYAEEFQFVLGLGQDELGYIVPGYDFWLTHLPENDENGKGPVPLGALEAEDPCGESHYEETVSASSVMAPWVTCIASELAGRDPWTTEPACTRANTHVHD